MLLLQEIEDKLRNDLGVTFDDLNEDFIYTETIHTLEGGDMIVYALGLDEVDNTKLEIDLNIYDSTVVIYIDDDEVSRFKVTVPEFDITSEVMINTSTKMDMIEV